MLQFRRLAFLLLPLSLLCGCGRTRPSPAPLPARLAKVLGPKGEVNAAGETPFWSAEVRPGLIRVSLGGEKTFTSGVGAFDGGPVSGAWSGKAGDGTALRLVVEVKPCRDADTGMSYPMSARADVAGHALFGCAAAPGQGLGPRQ